MGVQDRDWYREPRAPRRVNARSVALVICALALAVGLVGYSYVHTRGERSAGVAFRMLGGPAVPLVPSGLYPRHDPWRDYLAPESVCPGGEDAGAPTEQQLQTMVCLVDFARRKRGLGDLTVSPRLTISARLKGQEIERCHAFAHAPCGGDPHDVAVQAGYVGSFGENLYMAQGPLGAPRVALDGWLNSPGHRENVFRPEWRVQALYVVKLLEFAGHPGTTLWVSHFGDQPDLSGTGI